MVYYSIMNTTKKGKILKRKSLLALWAALLAGITAFLGFHAFADEVGTVAKVAAPTAARAYGTQLGVLAWEDDVVAISNKVAVVEEWAVGDDISLRVENAGETNATFSVVYTNDVMYSSVHNNSNVLVQAAKYTDSQITSLSGQVDDALGAFAWGDLTSSGAPATGTDALYVEKGNLAITGGSAYTRISASGYYVFGVSLGSEMTLSALAATNSAASTFSLMSESDTEVFKVTSTSSRTISAVAGDDMLAPTVDSSGANDVVRMVFPINASEHPTCLFAPTLSDTFAEATAANWPLYISSSTWTGSSGCYTNVITMVGKPNAGFFQGKIIRAGSTYTNFTSPIGLTKVVIGDQTYNVSVETINGKRLMVLEPVY